MNAQDLFRTGRVDETLEVLGTTLRSDPTDVRARTFLFELLCFAGDFDRASKHLDVIARSSKEAGLGAMLYRSALHAERIRQEMFEAIGEVGGDAPPTSVSGTLNGEAFSALTDADPRIGARLEVFAAGQYTWIPLAQLATVHIEEPKRLRDLLWAPARVTAGPDFRDFEFGEVLIPAVAPLSWKHHDWEVRLGREVGWADEAEEIPLGPKLLLVDGEPTPILDVRSLLVTASAPTG